jgi:hypothetical protein
LAISMLFNYTAFSTFSNEFLQQLSFVFMALLFDSLKITMSISVRSLWSLKHYIIAFFAFVAFILLTGISIIAGYVYLSNVDSQRAAENLKDSTHYKMTLESVAQAQTEVDSLIQFSSIKQATTKNARLIAIKKEVAGYNATPVKNYNKVVVGTFGQWNKCGKGQSRYNLFCSELQTLAAEKESILVWLEQHDSYKSSVAIVGQRQQTLVELGNGNTKVGLADRIQLEPFISFTRWLSVSYAVALSHSMFFLAVLCELLASLCFVIYSLFSTKSLLNTFTSKKTSQIDMTDNRLKTTNIVSFDGVLDGQIDEKKKTSSKQTTFAHTDNEYDRITSIVALGVCPPTLHSLRKHHNMTKKQVDIYQNKWLEDGLIEKVDKTNGISTYRLVKT